jgi:hypothetical protein
MIVVLYYIGTRVSPFSQTWHRLTHIEVGPPHIDDNVIPAGYESRIIHESSEFRDGDVGRVRSRRW